MKVRCARCGGEIPAEQINVAADVAFCPKCNEAFSLAQLVSAGDADDTPLGDPPKGCWLNIGINDWQLGATTRSVAALFLVPFMCVWSGFSLGGIYGTQLVKGKFDLTMSLFGIPFVLGTLLFGSIAVMTVCGKITVSVLDDEATVFMGVGPFGWRRRFRWSQIERVKEERRDGRDENQGTMICLEGPDQKVRLVSILNEERRNFMLRVLRRMLLKPSSPA